MLRIRCQCGKSLKLAAEYVGKAASCPQCRKPIRVVASDLRPDAEKFEGIFVIQGGPQRIGEMLFLGGRQAINVGKSTDANLRLRAASVSRLHCRLIPADQGWRVEDQNSTNGLFVNGRRIKDHNLLNGDLLRIGEFELRYLSQPGSKPAARQAASEAIPIAPDTTDAELHLLDDEAAMQQTAAVPSPASKPSSPWPSGDDVIGFADEDQICPKCGKTFPMDARICVDCGVDLKTGLSIAAGQATAKVVVSYFKACLASFAFMMEPGDLITFLIVAVIAALQIVIGFAPLFGFIGVFIVQGWICSFFFNVLVSAAGGQKDLPDLALTGGWVDDIIAPFFKFVGTWVLVLAPAIAYGVWAAAAAASAATAGATPPPALAPIFFVLMGLGIFLWPITVLIVALGGFSCFLRPDRIALTIARSLIPYIVVCIMTAIPVVATYYIEFLLDASTAIGGNVFVMEAVSWVLTIYCWIVAMRCIGLYYHHFKSRFAWSWG